MIVFFFVAIHCVLQGYVHYQSMCLHGSLDKDGERIKDFQDLKKYLDPQVISFPTRCNCIFV